jgi:hypothetical protein
MSRLVLLLAAGALAATGFAGTATAATCTPPSIRGVSLCVAGDCVYGWVGQLAFQTTTC